MIANHVGVALLDHRTMNSFRPCWTYTRTDFGFPGADNDLITAVVSKTVFADANC